MCELGLDVLKIGFRSVLRASKRLKLSTMSGERDSQSENVLTPSEEVGLPENLIPYSERQIWHSERGCLTLGDGCLSLFATN